MKAILEFNLPEDTREHLLAVHGAAFSSVCCDLDEQVRNWLKYGMEFKTVEEALQAVRDELRKLMEDQHISLDMSC